jgi:phage terminase large subunit-like protein
MKYKGSKVGQRHDAHKAFVEQRIYDDRQIVYVAGKSGLVVTRPNGSRRYRGSRRLCVVVPGVKRVVWAFNADQDEAPTTIYPTFVTRL